MDHFDVVKHVVVCATIGLSIPSLFWRVEIPAGRRLILHVVTACLLVCPYFVFSGLVKLGWQERASLLLLGWTRLNGTLLEILILERTLNGVRNNYKTPLGITGLITILAVGLQVTGICVSIFDHDVFTTKAMKDNPTTMSQVAKHTFHVGGILFHAVAALVWIVLIRKLGKLPRSQRWSLLLNIFIYIFVIGCGAGVIKTETQRLAFLFRGRCINFRWWDFHRTRAPECLTKPRAGCQDIAVD
ncbi:hypothetical protein PMIN06_011311 [Paraphaeosphaeria minitans]